MAEDTNEQETRLEMLALTSDIVSAHVSNNPVSGADLPLLMERVFATLTGLGNAAAKEPAEELKPAVPIRRSVMPDYLICLEDGKKLKMLKRHLRAAYDMSPEQYRERWGLPADYPMTAPNYAAQRKELALKIGLGRKAVANKPARRLRRKAAGETA
jgi:predicted transcriptional regulator